MALMMWSVAVLLVIVDGINIVVGCDDYSNYGITLSCPGKSCSDIYQKNPNSHGISDQYIVKIGEILHFVYCDMNLECGGEKGWMRIADINAADGDSCPSGWRKITSPTIACRAPNNNAGCHSAYFSTYNVPYNRVCGMVVGYQKGSTDGFQASIRKNSINRPYLDGVSITYGTSRKHLWSYAAGYNEYLDRSQAVTCPCTSYGGTPAPSFVRHNYYCESGAVFGEVNQGTYFTSDPLWDGKGCTSSNSCCSQPNLPWFYRHILVTINEDVEARICYNSPFENEAVLVKEIKLYVQ